MKLNTNIPADVYKKLKELALKLYNGRKGSMAQVLVNAINMYYATRMSTHTHGTKVLPNNPPPHVYKTYTAVKQYIERKMQIENPYEAPVAYLKEAIIYVRGADPRTIKKWLTLFERYGCIKFVSARVVELI